MATSIELIRSKQIKDLDLGKINVPINYVPLTGNNLVPLNYMQQYVADNTNVVWGGITGSIQNQTDLINLISSITGTSGSFVDTTNQYYIKNNSTLNEFADITDILLYKLSPAPPPSLNSKTLQITSSTVNAKLVDAVTINSVNFTKGQILPVSSSLSVSMRTETYTGLTGTYGWGNGNDVGAVISTYIDGSIPTGSQVTLTNNNDSGTYGIMNILEFDFWNATPQKSNFHNALNASLTTPILTEGVHTFTLESKKNLNYIYPSNASLVSPYSLGFDQGQTPTLSPSFTVSSLTPNSKYVSGVPSLSVGDNISITYSANGILRKFYRNGILATISSSCFNDVNLTDANAGTTLQPPYSSWTSSSPLTITNAIATFTSSYTEDVVFILKAYDYRGTQGQASYVISNSTGNTGKTLRIDSISNESSRKIAGNGNLPVSGYGGAYDPTQSLVSTQELQMVNGKYKYPSGNYTTNYFSGPNYNSLSFTGIRWVMFELNIVNGVNISVVLNSLTGATFDGNKLITGGFKLYVRVDGSTPTGGWVDGNSAYVNGNPSNDNTPALVVGSSDTNSNCLRVITFGSSVKTGTARIRIGIPNGSSIQFANPTISYS